jgi:hypothetical protein
VIRLTAVSLTLGVGIAVAMTVTAEAQGSSDDKCDRNQCRWAGGRSSSRHRWL